MFDWQEVVRRVGRSRTDFTLITWDDKFGLGKGIRLKCNCCGAWAQQIIYYEALDYAYDPDEVFADVIERLTIFLLRVDTTTGSRNADRRTVAGSGKYPPQKEVSA